MWFLKSSKILFLAISSTPLPHYLLITYSFINTWASVPLGLCFSSLYRLWCLVLLSSPVANWLMFQKQTYFISLVISQTCQPNALVPCSCYLSTLFEELLHTNPCCCSSKNVTSAQTLLRISTGLLTGMMKKFWKYIVLTVAQHCELLNATELYI